MPNNAMRETVNPAKNIDELLSHNDEQFVICAYLTLLGRTPDPEGMAYYLGRLLQGYGKAKVTTQIAASNDARKFGAELSGLRELVATQKRNDHWLWGFFSRGKRMEMQLNRLESKIATQTLIISQHIAKFETDLEQIHIIAPAAKTSQHIKKNPAIESLTVEELVQLAGIIK